MISCATKLAHDMGHSQRVQFFAGLQSVSTFVLDNLHYLTPFYDIRTNFFKARRIDLVKNLNSSSFVSAQVHEIFGGGFITSH